MDIEISQRKENKLLERLEVRFTVHHTGKNTPKRDEVAALLKNTLNTGSKVVVVDNLRSEFGRPATRGYAKVYDNKEAALKVESNHLLVRNKLAEKKVRAAPAAAAPAKKKGGR